MMIVMIIKLKKKRNDLSFIKKKTFELKIALFLPGWQSPSVLNVSPDPCTMRTGAVG